MHLRRLLPAVGPPFGFFGAQEFQGNSQGIYIQVKKCALGEVLRWI